MTSTRWVYVKVKNCLSTRSSIQCFNELNHNERSSENYDHQKVSMCYQLNIKQWICSWCLFTYWMYSNVIYHLAVR